MNKRHYLFRFAILLCWVFLTLGGGMVAQHQVAHAATSLPPGYSFTVTESTSTMTYGGTAPTIQAHLTVPDGDNPLTNPGQFSFKIDSQAFLSDGHDSSGSTYTFTLKGTSIAGARIPAGQHAVVADYFSIVLNQTLETAPITLTVQKATPVVSCQLNLLNPFGVNAPVSFTMSTSVSPSVDWQNATYTLTFVGLQTFTDTGLTADSDGNGTALTPPVPGNYKYKCTFNGTGNYNAAESGLGSTLVVSANHQPAIKLYSNPTTIKAGQSMTLEIVVSGGSGLPTPTGQIGLSMGNSFTRAINLESGGRVNVQITFPSPLPANTLQVNYFGDTVYERSFAKFPLTNPPISTGGTQPPPASTSTPTSTKTPPAGSTPAPSGTTIADSGTTSNDGTTSGSHPSEAASNQGNTLLWLVLIVFLLLAVGGIGAFIVLRNRTRAAPTPAMPTYPRSWDSWEDLDG
jgi:hypothetical protein